MAAVFIAILAVFDAVQAWRMSRHGRGERRLSQPLWGLRNKAFFDEDPGSSTMAGTSVAKGGETLPAQRAGWLRYPVADAASCRNEDLLQFVRS